ncbi:MAG: hypothetical protein U0U66_08270 [Cytophagaceae bacterium]
MQPPVYFIQPNGTLTPALEFFLNKSFAFSILSLQNTVWKSATNESLNLLEKSWCRITQLHGKMNASVMGRKVFYKNVTRTPLEWLYLIVHEQVHRHDVNQDKLFYLSYIVQGLYRAYPKISWEQRAYKIATLTPTNEKDQLSVLIQGKENLLLEIFQSNLSHTEKIDEISRLFHW